MFHDRFDAGRRLGKALARLEPERPIVVALPRGGVPVAFELAYALEAPLDVLAVRKIGHPQNPELAIGAVVDGEKPQVTIDWAAAERLGTSEQELRAAVERALQELSRRSRALAPHRPAVSINGRTVIVVDDGIATGHTMRAALQYLRGEKPSRLVMAVPVGPTRTLVEMRSECDLVVCLEEPTEFRAVSQAYEEFAQVSDDEVIALLDRARGRARTS